MTSKIFRNSLKILLCKVFALQKYLVILELIIINLKNQDFLN